jgi:predicted anti-sigma-YlaC factor YlaD
MQSGNICQVINSLISAYIDDELSNDECNKVKNHLKECKDCFSSYNELKSLSLMFKKNDIKQISYKNLAENAVKKVFSETEVKCSKVLSLLSSFVDGEVSVCEYYEIENHLKNCLKCKRKYNNLIKLANTVKEAFNGKIIKENVVKLYHEGQYCNLISQKLSLLYDERLVEAEKEFLQKHLDNCPECMSRYETFKTAMAPLKAYFEKDFSIPEKEFEVICTKSVRKAFAEKQNKSIVSSVAAMILTAFLAWNSLYFTESNFQKYNTISDKTTEEIQNNDYSKSENLLFKKFRAKTPEGVLASIYEY